MPRLAAARTLPKSTAPIALMRPVTFLSPRYGRLLVLARRQRQSGGHAPRCIRPPRPCVASSALPSTRTSPMPLSVRRKLVGMPIVVDLVAGQVERERNGEPRLVAAEQAHRRRQLGPPLVVDDVRRPGRDPPACRWCTGGADR